MAQLESGYQLVMTYDAAGVERWNREKNGFMDVCYACWYIRSGRVELEEGGRQYEVESGHWVLLDPFLKRRQRFEVGTHLLSVRFKIKWAGLAELRPSRSLVVISGVERPELLARAEALVISNGEGMVDQATRCGRLSDFYRWLESWHRMRQLDMDEESVRILDVRVERVVERLGENLGLGVLDYGALERAVGLSRTQIDRLFKKSFGITPRQWCERQCLFLSEEWLREKRYSIKEIAHRLRFFDGAHFAKWFRRNAGCSPGEFQRHLWL